MSFLGSGSLPTEAIPSVMVTIEVPGVSAAELARRLRLDPSLHFLAASKMIASGSTCERSRMARSPWSLAGLGPHRAPACSLSFPLVQFPHPFLLPMPLRRNIMLGTAGHG